MCRSASVRLVSTLTAVDPARSRRSGTSPLLFDRLSRRVTARRAGGIARPSAGRSWRDAEASLPGGAESHAPLVGPMARKPARTERALDAWPPAAYRGHPAAGL